APAGVPVHGGARPGAARVRIRDCARPPSGTTIPFRFRTRWSMHAARCLGSWFFLLAIVCAPLGGCDTGRVTHPGGGGGGGGDGAGGLTIMPASATLTVKGMPATQQFQAMLGGVDVSS